MKRFLIRMCYQKMILLILISLISFLVVKLAPGRPSQVDALNPRFTKSDVEKFRKAFDLDKPLPMQFYLFNKKFFTGSLLSFKDSQPVLEKIWGRFLNSLPLFIVGTLLTWSLAFPTGIFSAIHRGQKLDRLLTVLSLGLISIPSFVLAYFLIIFFVKILHLPVLGLFTFGQENSPLFFQIQDRFWHLVVPALLSATGGVAVLSRYVREQMSEVLDADYVRTAKAKGCSEASVYYHHALRNALIPFVTLFGLLLPELIGGSVIVETIFAWPGMGRLGYEAILARDYPVIISLNFISAILVLIGTTLSDVLYTLVDPRIRVSEK